MNVEQMNEILAELERLTKEISAILEALKNGR